MLHTWINPPGKKIQSVGSKGSNLICNDDGRLATSVTMILSTAKQIPSTTGVIQRKQTSSSRTFSGSERTCTMACLSLGKLCSQFDNTRYDNRISIRAIATDFIKSNNNWTPGTPTLRTDQTINEVKLYQPDILQESPIGTARWGMMGIFYANHNIVVE